jgi:hypothetical protein
MATAAGLLMATFAFAANRPPPGLAAQCPAAASALVEHFIGADCVACWQAAPSERGRPHTPGAETIGETEWSLDWIVPAAADAAMAPGALPEAADRLARLGPHLAARLQSAPAAFDTGTALAQPDPKRRFYVHSSLPYQGYMGVQMHATGVWPVGSSAWVALVELIPVGTRGTQIPRRLVRVLVGPVKLPEDAGAQNAVAPLHGLRWPENAHPENLVATAWVEGRDGRILQIATDRCDDPK